MISPCNRWARRRARVSSDDQVGRVQGVTLKNIFVTGKPIPESSLTGLDAQHDIRDVSIENLRFNGRTASNAEAAHIKLNGFADQVHFGIGAMNEQEKVLDEATLPNTTSGELGTVITGTQTEQLPLNTMIDNPVCRLIERSSKWRIDTAIGYYAG